MPFLDHLEELRWRIIWALGALAIGLVAGFIIVTKFELLHLLQQPIAPYLAGEARAAAALAKAVARTCEDTGFLVVANHGVPDALIRAGTGARLLVVGDKRRGVIGRARTGDVPLTVAADAPCPVAVIPLHQREGEPL